MRLVAVGLAVLTVLLVLSGPQRVRRPASGSLLARLLRPGPGVAVLVAAVVGGLLVVVDGTRLLLALVLVGIGLAVGVLVRRGRVARAAALRQAFVVEVCESLVGELRAGQPLVAGLEHCLDVWVDFEPVVAAARLSADVPEALRRLSSRPGAEGLREIASAWQVSERSGAGLAAALSQVARTARSRQSTRHLVRGELASAQATARLVAGLPLVSLAMSAGIGGSPWHFLLGTAFGITCLGGGALFAFLGLLWIDRIARAVLRT
ncbi:MAG: type II secretion system F family protein [Nocardioidaceae bacterium]